ncbi:MAG TPA: phosphatase PAP2 family protein [Niallia sp.]|nr:phosphatase PAP2 family protein [Niallia sp.]
MDIRKSKAAWGAIILTILLTIITFIAIPNEGELTFDTVIIDFLQTIFPSSMHSIFEGISYLGTKIGIGIVALLFIIWLVWKAKDFVGIATFVLCVGLGNIMNNWIKDVIERPRPITASLEDADSFSFPSGHAMVGLLLYLFIAHLLSKEIKRNSRKLVLAGVALLLILLIGISRIVLGAHYPTDVIGGYLIGGIWLFIWIIIYETLHEVLNRREKKRV